MHLALCTHAQNPSSPVEATTCAHTSHCSLCFAYLRHNVPRHWQNVLWQARPRAQVNAPHALLIRGAES
eukprot:1158973-Pelagomonas_calceolata.AAC.7